MNSEICQEREMGDSQLAQSKFSGSPAAGNLVKFGIDGFP